MGKRALCYLLTCSALAPLGTAALGGWAVVTVQELPGYLVVGQPVTIEFAVRQHGMTLLPDLKPQVEARSGGEQLRVSASPARTAGHYTAQLVVTKPGDWAITIRSGFGDSKGELLPIPAIAAGSQPPAVDESENGRRLFVGKGCNTCHVKPGVETPSWASGPDLTGRKFALEYLKLFLPSPATVKPPAAGKQAMPSLELSGPEIAALSAYLNADRYAAR